MGNSGRGAQITDTEQTPFSIGFCFRVALAFASLCYSVQINNFIMRYGETAAVNVQ
jgi:hypothetical protein